MRLLAILQERRRYIARLQIAGISHMLPPLIGNVEKLPQLLWHIVKSTMTIHYRWPVDIYLADFGYRYGRVQSVKLFSRKGGGECDGSSLVGCGTTGICATVSFMDIKSASKAHNTEHKLDEHLLTTEYHEPGPIPPSASPASNVPPSVSSGGSPVTQVTPPSLRHPPPYSSPRFSHG